MPKERTKHLEMLQAIITRMNTNSFLVKGWSVTLVAALFVLAAKDTDVKVAALAYFPSIAFWVLDGFFLHQERLFRALYDAVRRDYGAIEPFSMDTSPFENEGGSWVSACVSQTLLLFHGVIVVVILIVMCIV